MSDSAATGRKKEKRMCRCPYCGRWAFSPACAIHRDLLAIDPHYLLQARTGTVSR